MGRTLVGGLILIIGLNWLFRNLGLNNLLASIEWGKVWPIIFIFLGLMTFSWRGVRGLVLGSAVTILTVVLVLAAIFGESKSNWEISSQRQAWTPVNNQRQEVVEEKREVNGFNQVKIDGIGKLIVTQGEEEGLTITTDKRIAEMITTKVNNSELVISYNNKNWLDYLRMPREGVIFNLKVRELKRIEANGAVEVETEGLLRTNYLELRPNGATKGRIEVESGHILGVMNGAGDIRVSGRTDTAYWEINGAGKYDTLELESKSSEAKIRGAGNIRVSAVEDLKVTISGSGKVEYKGDPRVVENVSGAGKVEKIN